jgi:holo-[acyl-carrier protein] synthase
VLRSLPRGSDWICSRSSGWSARWPAGPRSRSACSAAARFCAKEAVSKALGLRVFAPHDIEVIGGGEAVALALHGAARARAEELGVQVDVSLTHTRGMAAAVAVLR